MDSIYAKDIFTQIWEVDIVVYDPLFSNAVLDMQYYSSVLADIHYI